MNIKLINELNVNRRKNIFKYLENIVEYVILGWEMILKEIIRYY